MHRGIICSGLAFALVAALTPAVMAPTAMAQGDATEGSLTVPEQIGVPKHSNIQSQIGQPTDSNTQLQIGVPTDDKTQLQIEPVPAQGAPQGKTRVEQPEGQDLCDPSVAEAVRRAAGVDCERQISTSEGKARPTIAEDPLLSPRDETLKGDFDDLNLGDDVPATVILQQ